jgi:hypothetical protein
MEAWAILNNTQGARTRCRATRPRSDEETDPAALVAGEISSIYGHLYLEAGNITEGFVPGKIAGQNAAAERSWS